MTIENRLKELEKKINTLCLPEGTYKPTLFEMIKAAIIYGNEGRNILPANTDWEHVRLIKRAFGVEDNEKEAINEPKNNH